MDIVSALAGFGRGLLLSLGIVAAGAPAFLEPSGTRGVDGHPVLEVILKDAVTQTMVPLLERSAEATMTVKADVYFLDNTRTRLVASNSIRYRSIDKTWIVNSRGTETSWNSLDGAALEVSVFSFEIDSGIVKSTVFAASLSMPSVPDPGSVLALWGNATPEYIWMRNR